MNVNFYLNQTVSYDRWMSPELGQHDECKNKVNDSLVSYWAEKSKDTDFIEDLNKQPALISLVKYDTKFNNKRKVELESSLAGLIRFHPRMLHDPVIKVAKAIASDLMLSLVKIINEKVNKGLHQHLYNFFSKNSDIMSEYTGLYDNKISSDLTEKGKFILWIYNKLQSSDST